MLLVWFERLAYYTLEITPGMAHSSSRPSRVLFIHEEYYSLVHSHREYGGLHTYYRLLLQQWPAVASAVQLCQRLFLYTPMVFFHRKRVHMCELLHPTLLHFHSCAWVMTNGRTPDGTFGGSGNPESHPTSILEN